MQVNKRQLHNIQERAFEEFMKLPNAKECFYNGNGTRIHFYLITEKTKSEIHQFEFKQLNQSNLKDLGFSKEAKTKLLFIVDKQLKQLIFN